MTVLDIITSPDGPTRDYPFDLWAAAHTPEEWHQAAASLEQFRRQTPNLYEKVRALAFLSNLYRFHIAPSASGRSLASYAAVEFTRSRRFDQAIAVLTAEAARQGISPALAIALAAAYSGLTFQTLADQVRRSVRNFPGNRWMFRAGHPSDYPLRLRPELLTPNPFPVLEERTPVRMDLSHSAWSDIFFLAMDYPEGARVVNISVDLANRAAGQGSPRPPITTFLRVIDEPVLRLASVDLDAQADLVSVDDVFDFGRDYLGLLKAALVAGGVIPSGLEGTGQPLAPILARLTGSPDLGLELASEVNQIPKGSRLAVSTNLLASLIAICMRATGQIGTLTGPLAEPDRRIVAARAILGEWLGGSGGGWQDSGGIWPGIKQIEGVLASEGQPEFGGSRGALLPRHRLLNDAIAPEARRRLEESLVLVHGGMSQDVGPILEMCTERYLLRSSREWEGRQRAVALFDELVAALTAGDIRRLAQLTQDNYDGPIQTVIPWAANAYSEALIGECRKQFGERFWGFWMLGGMAGGGMGFVFDPSIRAQAVERMGSILLDTKRRMESAVAFAIDPVVYDFRINSEGTTANLLQGPAALLSKNYYLQTAPPLLRRESHTLSAERRQEFQRVAASYRDLTEPLFERLFPSAAEARQQTGLPELLDRLGFDPVAHEHLSADYRSSRVGLAQNRLPANATIADARPGDVITAVAAGHAARGEAAIRDGRLMVVTLAGGAGTRWTKGAGTVKALSPFCRLRGRYWNFAGIHLAKTARARQEFGAAIPHVFTASYLTRGPMEEFIASQPVPAQVSPGRSIGLRMVPTVADLRYLWEVLPQEKLDHQKEKLRDSVRAAILQWVRKTGEAAGYTDNVPAQCIHPVGHWYEFPNLLLNGLLARLLAGNPKLEYVLLHNVDTLGAMPDPALLGAHIAGGATMTIELIGRWFGDHGGGLARVDGRPRLVEGLCLPSEEVEFGLSYYNTGTYWMSIDPLLNCFGLTRATLDDPAAVAAAVRRMAQRVPSYITIKDVKKRWGHGQEDVLPVAQFERLWGDMTALEDVTCQYVEVSRFRGHQLKDVAQLDVWMRDGSAAALERLL